MKRALPRRTYAVFAFSLLVFPTSLFADEAAVKEVVAKYVAAFNEHDAKAVAALWSDKGIHVDREMGIRTEGREAIARDLEIVFEASPNAQLSGEITAVRMIRPDVATVEGETMLSGNGTIPSRSAFTMILTSSAEGWHIDSAEEMPLAQPANSGDALRQLDWLVGTWRDQSDSAVIETHCKWAPNETFLLRTYVVAIGDEVERQGTQIIAWDANRQEIRSWNFDTTGAFGEGTWSKNGDEWLIRFSQTSVDGLVTSGTYVMQSLDVDTISVQLIGQEADGKMLPNQEPIRVVRVLESDESPSSAPAIKGAVPSPGSAAVPSTGAAK